jgi:cephalosporin hydroxylase
MRALLHNLLPPRTVTEPAPKEIIAGLEQPFVDTLCSMYQGDPQIGWDGKQYPIDAITRVGPRQGMLIYELVRQLKPANTLETGLAFGFSTMYFLAAIHANCAGHHVAIDPFQFEWWHGIGAVRARITGMDPGSFEFTPETSVMALTRLARQEQRFGVIFIDGDHTFDGALVDFCLAALLCEPGSYVILDDMWMPSIKKAVSFLSSNRQDFSLVPTPVTSLAVFRRIDADRRKWDHFVPF